MNIVEIKKALALFEQREKMARGSIENHEKGWYFGIVGIEIDNDKMYLGDENDVYLEKIVMPPMEVEVVRAISEKYSYNEVSRYTKYIKCQLFLLNKGFSDDDYFTAAWWITTLIKIKLNVDFIVPVVSSHSYDAIAAIKDNTCHIQIIEDFPIILKKIAYTNISNLDEKWIDNHFLTYTKLLEDQGFRLAVNAFTECMYQSNSRTSLTLLWAGIESLFELQNELSFRLSIYIASLIGKNGIEKIDLYRKIKKMYAIRSKCVHGSKVNESIVINQIVEVKSILSKILLAIIENGSMFSEEELNVKIFGI